jgi:TolA-binding protein
MPEEVKQATVHADVMQKPKKSGRGLVIAIIIVVIVSLLACSGIWFVMNKKLNDQKKQNQEQIQQLNKKINELETQSQDVKADESALTAAETKAEIVAAVSNKQYSNLAPLMADQVEVTIAASEKGGEVSKAQAVADMAYLKSGTSPWNFNPTTAQVNTFKNGSYKVYLSAASIFGIATNDYFVAFTLDSSNKISKIFMSVNTELLP